MIKTIILHHLLDVNDLPAAERWFYRYHIPEVLRNHPVSYVSYRAVPPPPGAEDYGYYNYKVHENLNRGEGEKPLGLTAMTKEVVPLKVIMVNVPAVPTEDLLGKGTSFEERTILRWLIAFRYPEGVGVEEGDDWYVNVHARKSCSSRGCTRFFSYRVIAPPEVMGQSSAGVPAPAVPGVLQLAPDLGAVVREQQRLGRFGRLVTAAVHEAAVGHGRPLPVPRARRGLRQHVHPRAAERTTGSGRYRPSTSRRLRTPVRRRHARYAASASGRVSKMKSFPISSVSPDSPSCLLTSASTPASASRMPFSLNRPWTSRRVAAAVKSTSSTAVISRRTRRGEVGGVRSSVACSEKSSAFA